MEWNENEPDGKTWIAIRDSIKSEEAVFEQGADAAQSVTRSTKMSPIMNERITQTPGYIITCLARDEGMHHYERFPRAHLQGIVVFLPLSTGHRWPSLCMVRRHAISDPDLLQAGQEI